MMVLFILNEDYINALLVISGLCELACADVKYITSCGVGE